MNGDLLATALFVLGLVLIALGTFLVRRFGGVVQAMWTYRLLEMIVATACTAADQLGDQQFWTGEQKKRYARTVIRSALDRLGLTLTDEEIDAMIEATVHALRDGERMNGNL